MKYFKRVLSFVLVFIILAVGLPVTRLTAKAEDVDYSEYSDILYAYSDYLNDSGYLQKYIQDTQGAFDSVYMDYIESTDFIAMSVKESLLKSVNLVEWLQIMGSALGLNNYVYENALDNANELFVKHLLSASQMTMVDTMGAGSDWAEKLSKIAELYEHYEKWADSVSATDTEKLNMSMEFLYNSGILETVSDSDIKALQYIVIENDTASKMFSTVGDVLKAGKALMIALVMEDMRVYTVDCIMKFSPQGALGDGMQRLQSQLKNGFVSYFAENFLKGEIIKKISDDLVDRVVSYGMGSATVFSVVKLIVEVSVFVIFDVIFDVDSLDDFTTQRIITEYAYDCSSMLMSANKIFEKSFTHDDIVDYQNLYTVLRAITDASFEASRAISLTSNVGSLNYYENNYKDDNLYEKTIKDVKEIVDKIPVAERRRTFYENWYVNENAVVDFGSDILSNSEFYCPEGEFCGNVTLAETKQIIIPEDANVKIAGDLNLWKSWGSEQSGYTDPDLVVNGELEVTGTICPIRFGYEKIVNNGTLKLHKNAGCEIESLGDIIFCGTDEQQITNTFTANNVYVENEKGLIYQDSPTINGKFLLNGNPLNNNGYATIVGSQNFDWDDSDYKSISIPMDFEITKDIKADITLAETKQIIIPEDANVKIAGDLNLCKSWGSEQSGYTDPDLVVNGELEVTGTICPIRFGYEKIVNNGTLKLHKNAGCEIESLGDIIFCGTDEQQITNAFTANNVYVENEKGLIYQDSPTINGKFLLNGNPLNNNGYATYIGENFSYDSVSDYKDLYTSENYTVTKDIKANFNVAVNKKLIIPENTNVKIDGYVNLNGWNSENVSNIENYGNTEITGYITNSFGGKLVNSGTLKIKGNLYCNFEGTGTLILNGEDLQNVGLYSYVTDISKMIIENKSAEGVVFNSCINVTELFNHNGNKFTLYDNGNQSDFVDYDGDSMKDNIDPDPTVFDGIYHYTYNYGDLNGDSNIDVLDLIKLKNAVLNDNKDSVYDVNKDNGINSLDILVVRKFLFAEYELFLKK